MNLKKPPFFRQDQEQPRKNRGKGGYINNKIEYYNIKTRDFPDTICTVSHTSRYTVWERLL
jgi:stalled ribosome alternative rescue factor ArfA